MSACKRRRRSRTDLIIRSIGPLKLQVRLFISLPAKSLLFLSPMPIFSSSTTAPSLLPPHLLLDFSDEVISEAIVMNLRRGRWHDLNRLLPEITDNLVCHVILRCCQSPQLALYFFQWSERNRQQRKIPSLCLHTHCALIHVLVAAKMFNESLGLMKQLMQQGCVAPLDLLASLGHLYANSHNLAVYDALVRACTQLGASKDAYFVIKTLRGSSG